MNSSSGSPDALRGRQLTEDILTAFSGTENAVQLAESLRWSMQEVSRRLEKEFEAPIPGTALPRFGKVR
jgi:D-serine dehydratase